MISLSITYHELSNEIQKINIAISCNILTVRKSCKFKTTEKYTYFFGFLGISIMLILDILHYYNEKYIVNINY